MAFAMCQAYPTFYLDYHSNSLFISVSENVYEKFIVTQDYCISNYPSFYPVKNCKFHLVLIGLSLDQILQRFDKYHFTYQIVDCIYTLYKCKFHSNVISSSGEVFNQLNRAVEHNLKCRVPEKLPSVANKHLLRKKFKIHYLSSAQHLASTQTLGSAFLERIQKIQNLKYETDLLKFVDCFIDGYGTVNSERVSFSINN